ncbi:hypothetical protein GN160_01980 [Blochmannia endosymbiont of Colobopsis nipponica]|uniref:hypothetical protein n=1 Tax=Blochmannia endosymbiont of Colobopsis nipponica TaxID=2681987 RepID=UPI0017803B61|nr:hypothetical protein [Blochmannia endosymbiont of Colobopsis nipponica]QOI10800.1 hypothetical protein GN160_01980 [Blochmannia endosymbiont of Colobopsis nipponica]
MCNFLFSKIRELNILIMSCIIPFSLYRKMLKEKKLKYDAFQEMVVIKMNDMHQKLNMRQNSIVDFKKFNIFPFF